MSVTLPNEDPNLFGAAFTFFQLNATTLQGMGEEASTTTNDWSLHPLGLYSIFSEWIEGA